MIKLASMPFKTVQGEGKYLGVPMTFVRFAGCSVGCPKCDTDYGHKLSMSSKEIASHCAKLRLEWVWITGGEPTDQMDGLIDLVGLLAELGHKVALASSGIRDCPHVHFLSISPHSPDFVQRVGTEIKLVPGLNGLKISDIDISTIQFAYRYVMPMHGSDVSIKTCMDFVSNTSGWLMTTQAHKAWRIP